MNKCLLYECPDVVANPKFKFCSGTHYQIFQNRKAERDDWFSANKCMPQQQQYDDLIAIRGMIHWAKPPRMDHNIEEVELLNL